MMPKFRAWDKKTKSFINDCDIVLDLISGKVYAGDIGLTDSINDVTDQIVLMQSTGLKDKNSVEIFEGDIVLADGFQVTVSFGEQKYEEDYGDETYYIGFNVYTKMGYGMLIPVKYEVLGNIYANPELLS